MFLRHRRPVYVTGRPGPHDRPAFPSGHPVPWGLITSGTMLDGVPYPLPVFDTDTSGERT